MRVDYNLNPSYPSRSTHRITPTAFNLSAAQEQEEEWVKAFRDEGGASRRALRESDLRSLVQRRCTAIAQAA